jgi:carboxyl-terminal processing protease
MSNLFQRQLSWPIRACGLFLLLQTAVLPASPSLAAVAKQSLQDSPKAIVDEVWQFVNQYYVDPKFNQLDWQALRSSLLATQYNSPEKAYDTIRATLNRLNDPFTRFLTPPEYAKLLEQTTGDLIGVGIDLGLSGKDLRVNKIQVNSPAAKAGVKVGDLVLSINGRPTDRMTVEQATRLIQGMAGMPTLLTLSRGQQPPFSVKILREGEVAQTVQSQVVPVPGGQVGYIRLSLFNADSAKQMSQAIASLNQQKVKGFILDLRDNPGGLLGSGVEIARMWLNQGVIVQILERQDKKVSLRANRTALTQLPLVVLVNQSSASASEILAAALQDNRRAVLVGSPTFGKALVQVVHELSDGSALVATVAHYYTPRGNDIAKKGITPDVSMAPDAGQTLELRLGPQFYGTIRDNDFNRALEILSSKIRSPVSTGEFFKP